MEIGELFFWEGQTVGKLFRIRGHDVGLRVLRIGFLLRC